MNVRTPRFTRLLHILGAPPSPARPPATRHPAARTTCRTWSGTSGVRPCAARVTSGLRAQDRGTGDARHPIHRLIMTQKTPIAIRVRIRGSRCRLEENSTAFGVSDTSGAVHGYHNFRFHATGAATRAHARAPLRLTRPSLPAPPRWLVPLGPALALPQAEARLPHPAGAGTRRCQ